MASTTTSTPSESAAEAANPIVFSSLQGNMQFVVNVPNPKGAHWINELNGSYCPKRKGYVFLLEHLSEVEAKLGFKPGTSGLRDPKHYFQIQLEGDVYSATTRADLEKALAPLGIHYDKQRKAFRGKLSQLDTLSSFIAK
jgi:hypothetical protein